MAWWVDLATDLLWRNALGLIPLVLLAVVFCRWVPTRPATRHAVWLVVLLGLVVPPVLPQWDAAEPVAGSAGQLADPPTARDECESLLAAPAEGVASTYPSPAPRALKYADCLWIPVSESAAFETCPSRSRTEPRVPERLAPAPSSVGRLFDSVSESDFKWCRANAGQPPAEHCPADPAPTEAPAPLVMVAEAPAAKTGLPAHDAGASERANRWRFAYGGVARMAALRDALGAAVGGSPMPSIIWLIGVGVMLLAAIGRGVWFSRRIRSATPAPAAMTDMVDRAAATLGLQRVPEVLTVADSVSPLVWCPPLAGRTRLILPAELWSQLDDLGRRAVVLHELAHLKRRDHWVRWIETIVGALYWWNPVVWWVRRRLREEAELCCDAWVTWLLPRGRRAYAEALLTTKQYVCRNRISVPAVGIGVTTGRARRFARRLTMVMTERTTPKLSGWGIGLALALAVIGWIATPARSAPPESSMSGGSPVATEPTEAVDLRADNLRVLLAGGTERGSDDEQARAHRETQRRLERLEKQMQMLAEKLDRLADDRGEREKLRQAWEVQELPKVPGAGVPKPPNPPPAGISSGETLVRAYHLPSERLEALTELMIRSDVPVRVRPLDDGIEVHGSEWEHMVFEGFVALIDPHKQEQSYHLPDGKLEALTALMVRPDVPVMVKPGKDQITVHGTGLEQSVFAAFVDIIHPTGEARVLEEFYQAAPGEAKHSKKIKEKAKTKARKRVKERASRTRAREEARALARQVGGRVLELADVVRDLQQQGQAVRVQADQLELQGKQVVEQSQRIQRQADELRKRADKLRAKARQTGNDKERAALEAEAKALVESAQPLMDLAADLGEKARDMSEAAREHEEQARQIEQEAEQLEEEAYEDEEDPEDDDLEEEDPDDGDWDEEMADADASV